MVAGGDAPGGGVDGEGGEADDGGGAAGRRPAGPGDRGGGQVRGEEEERHGVAGRHARVRDGGAGGALLLQQPLEDLAEEGIGDCPDLVWEVIG